MNQATAKPKTLTDKDGQVWTCVGECPSWNDVRDRWLVAIVLHAGEGPIGTWKRIAGVPPGTRWTAHEVAEGFAGLIDDELAEDMKSEDGDRVPVAVQLGDGAVALFSVGLEIRREWAADFTTEGF